MAWSAFLGSTPKRMCKSTEASNLVMFTSFTSVEASFNEYWGEMPFLALPYVNRSKKDALSKKYKVSGIPSLIVLNNKAETITTGGRGKVTEDPEGFPWTPKTFDQLLTGNLINNKNETVDSNTLKSNTAIGIYFSAHWCPPCRAFTPQLVNTYNTIKSAGKKFEIIFASSDHDQNSFKEYLDEMPWKAFPFGDGRINALSDLYGVEGIPMLVIVDPSNGKIINKSGRGAVSADPHGENFPWQPKPLNSIESAGSDLNEKACVIYIEKDLSDGTKAALNNVATSYVEKWKKEGKEEDPVVFFFGTAGGNMATRVKDFCNIKTDPACFILDLQLQQKFVHDTGSGKPSEDDFRTFVDSYLAGSLTKKGIKD